MTALVGRQVKRTFSGFVANSTGLPGQCTLKAYRQDFGEFNEALVRNSLIHGVIQAAASVRDWDRRSHSASQLSISSLK